MAISLIPGLAENAIDVSSEAREFALSHGLSEALEKALQIVRLEFTLRGVVAIRLEHDCGTEDGSFLAIEAPVVGEPSEVADSHWRFAEEAAKSLGLGRERIRLICNLL